MRPLYEDETIVQRAELIAVGHLKENSIQYVPHENKPPEGKSWEHHATLIISEITKGKSETNEIPIIIHYGLTPVVGGYVKQDGFMMDARGGRKDIPTNLVQIFDTAELSLTPVVEDAGKDNIWFLRQGTGIYGLDPGRNNLGIVDPEDVQPLKLKQYFEAYLNEHPEDAVKTYASDHPDVAGRAQRYLNHLVVQRILKIEDPATRFDSLLPHYLNRELWADGKYNMTKDEIRNGIIACGGVAGEKLIPVFNDPAHKDFRKDIILIWRDMDHTNAAPLLIQLLKDHDQFWAAQTLTNGWRSAGDSSELTQKRRDFYIEVYYSVATLRTFHYPQSKEAIELMQKRWKSIKYDSYPQILEECDAALKELGNTQ